MSKYTIVVAAILGAVFTAGLMFSRTVHLTNIPRRIAYTIMDEPSALAAVIIASSSDAFFSEEGVVEEAGNESESSDPYWWVSSGGILTIGNAGRGATAQGKLGALSKWRIAYAVSNPEDTDGGYRPQNIFRLVTRSEWKNERTETYVRIVQTNASESRNRNESNGILHFMRYADENNLYYSGIRVDGAAVVKKKIRGIYYTLAYEPIPELSEGGPYDRNANPNVLPEDVWIGMRTEITNEPNGSVKIELYTDIGRTGEWKQAAIAYDTGGSFGGAAFLGYGKTGIRTDFMDVEFEGFQVRELRIGKEPATIKGSKDDIDF